MSGAAICTLVRGRRAHLVNMLRGCLSQTRAPKMISVAVMEESLPDLPSYLAERCTLTLVGGDRLPLAEARNAAADAARGCEQLIFLDVDCIPSPDLVENAVADQVEDRCLMGDCRYLSGEDDPEASFSDLWEASEKHPARPSWQPDGEARTMHITPATELWSLAFALPSAAYWKIGGFDTRFEGYGGEDTDFAIRLGEAGIALHYAPLMRAVHQWHRVAKPPLHHFDDIIVNARTFREKHGSWCMDYWLEQLERDGFVQWSEDRLEVTRRPSGDDLEAALQPASVRFS